MQKNSAAAIVRTVGVYWGGHRQVDLKIGSMDPPQIFFQIFFLPHDILCKTQPIDHVLNSALEFPRPRGLHCLALPGGTSSAAAAAPPGWPSLALPALRSCAQTRCHRGIDRGDRGFTWHADLY